MSVLTQQHCAPCAAGTPPLTRAQADALAPQVRGWSLDDAARNLSRTFDFANYYATLAFVNAVAWIAHQEDHHPEMEVGYNRCRVCYSTHSIGGLSHNDFICAARINRLLQD
jgi:4a-hydroxytetrahydrobiopterin dehydratase